MRKVTNVHYLNIIAITSATLQEYTDFCLRCAKHADSTADSNVMHLADILYMQRALNAFINNNNVAQLQDSIMMQDTFVREYYINTLRYLEDNNLVAQHYCV
jgi:hypothetical protein